jgi:hypothetical protein
MRLLCHAQLNDERYEYRGSLGQGPQLQCDGQEVLLDLLGPGKLEPVFLKCSKYFRLNSVIMVRFGDALSLVRL